MSESLNSGASCDCSAGQPNDDRHLKGSWLKNLFNTCAACVRDGGSGAIVSHLVTCVILPATLGAAFSGALMTGAMLIASPLIAAGVGYGIDKLRGHKTTLAKTIGSAALAFGIACGYLAFKGHDEHTHHTMYEPIECPVPPSAQDTVLTERDKKWMNDHSPADQAEIKRQATVQKKPLKLYLDQINCR